MNMDFSWSSFSVGLIVGIAITLVGVYYFYKNYMEKNSKKKFQEIEKLMGEQQIEIARSLGLSEVQINRIKQQSKAKKKKNKSNK